MHKIVLFKKMNNNYEIIVVDNGSNKDSQDFLDDIEKDGMLSGPNFKSIKEISTAVDMGVIASGGISGIKDVEHLLNMEKYGVTGMIIGKALYTGKLDLKEAIKLARDFKPEAGKTKKQKRKK